MCVYFLIIDTLPKILSYTAVKDEKLSAVYFFSNGLLRYIKYISLKHEYKIMY